MFWGSSGRHHQIVDVLQLGRHPDDGHLIQPLPLDYVHEFFDVEQALPAPLQTDALELVRLLGLLKVGRLPDDLLLEELLFDLFQKGSSVDGRVAGRLENVKRIGWKRTSIQRSDSSSPRSAFADKETMAK